MFGDIYFQEYLSVKGEITKEELNNTNLMLEQLISLTTLENTDLETLFAIFRGMWNLQLFLDGNIRTLLAYLKLYIECFNLLINFD